MNFSIYKPENYDKDMPVLFWLSGLTCTEHNFFQKSGIAPLANRYGLIVAVVDTSPRNVLPRSERWWIGEGAGYYLNAEKEPWSENMLMETYFIEEFIPLIKNEFSQSRFLPALSGHSMGGHGALYLGLKYPKLFSSLTAFAPISDLPRCEWGQDALLAYLGDDKDQFESYSVYRLLQKVRDEKDTHPDILIDQGSRDGFLQQLQPEKLQGLGSEKQGQFLRARMQEGYDHSYYFVSSFLKEHLEFHKSRLIEV